MKRNLLLLPALFLCAVLIACGGSGDKKAEGGNDTAAKSSGTERNGTPTKLEGAWVIKRAAGIADSMNIGTVYTFSGNTLTFGKDGFNNPGVTEVTDSTFSFQAEGNDYKFMYNYHFAGDTLVVEMQKSNGQIFHMVKE